MKNKIDFCTILIILVANVVCGLVAMFALNQFDSAFEDRAKAAGYYEVMSDNLKR